jgi:hypothetical protein
LFSQLSQVEYALAIQWEETQNKPNIKNGTAIDGDNPTHIKWLYDRAIERAQKYFYFYF